MHSPSTLEKLNAAATAKAIQNRRADGKYVVVQWAGANILTFATHTERPQVVEKHELATHVEVLSTATAAEAALIRGRDQSEDYAG